jgi:hypothetical protein
LLIAQVAGQADAFKGSIECPLGNGLVLQSRKHGRWDTLSGSKVDDLHFAAVSGITEEQDFKVRRLYIAVHTGLGKVGAAVGLNID